jgi:hypothetical protein
VVRRGAGRESRDALVRMIADGEPR